MRYFSLFTGIGGFELGIQKAYESNNEHAHISEESEQEERPQGRVGATDKHGILLHDRDRTAPLCIGFSEIDKYAIQIYQKHFPEHKNYGDITKINEKELPDFELLCGGFPCQSFSIAGKRGGFADTRGTLFFDICRILAEKRPRLLLLENVKGLLSHDQGRTFATIISTLDELGYDLQWQVLNSKNFGVPQNRERVFIIGHLRGTTRPKVFPFGEGHEASVREDKDIAGAITANYWKGPETYGGRTFIEQLNKPKHSNNRVYAETGISPTLSAMQGGNRQPFVATRRDGMEVEMEVSNSVTPDAYLTSGKRKIVNGKTELTSMFERRIRRLTPTECERLQGFPDGWTEGQSDTQRYKCLGNAVTVNVIQAVAEKLL